MDWYTAVLRHTVGEVEQYSVSATWLWQGASSNLGAAQNLLLIYSPNE